MNRNIQQGISAAWQVHQYVMQHVSTSCARNGSFVDIQCGNGFFLVAAALSAKFKLVHGFETDE
jgi:tRNA/tmRNA/rRNA uracil-C5-methylase (TrmA/RlmC/RlmD family)